MWCLASATKIRATRSNSPSASHLLWRHVAPTSPLGEAGCWPGISGVALANLDITTSEIKHPALRVTCDICRHTTAQLVCSTAPAHRRPADPQERSTSPVPRARSEVHSQSQDEWRCP